MRFFLSATAPYKQPPDLGWLVALGEWFKSLLGFGWVPKFLSSGLWDGIAGIASLISLIAIALAVYEFLKEKRRTKVVLWQVEGWATATFGDRLVHLEVLKIGQTSGSPLQIFNWSVVNGSLYRDETYGYSWQMQAGETMTVAFKTSKPKLAWFLIMWVEVDDNRWMNAEWFPIADDPDGSRLEGKYQSPDNSGRKPWWKPASKHWAAKPVGPEGAGRTRFAIDHKTLKEDMVKVLSLVSAAEDGNNYAPSLRSF